MRFLSVCSGIEAASVAWKPLGWECVGVSEIEPFANAVLAHHYPEVKNFGDFTQIEAEDVGGVGAVDLLVGGTPCQDFSVAGLRAGLAGDRGRLTIEFYRLAGRLRPRWLVWENVPGVLSADHGNAFGIFLGALEELGYGVAYRVLNAQYFGVPQRRRRVFVIGYLRDWRCPAAVLFERDSLSGNPLPRRKTRTNTSGSPENRVTERREDQREDRVIVTPSLTASGNGVMRVKGAARSDDVEWFQSYTDAVAFGSKGDGADIMTDGNSPTLRAGANRETSANGGVPPAIAFSIGNSSKARGIGLSEEITPPLRSGKGGDQSPGIAVTSAVRRLTPRECERLQGFPEDYTLVPYRKGESADGPRYRALGNSMAVPVMRWIGERINLIEELTKGQ